MHLGSAFPAPYFCDPSNAPLVMLRLISLHSQADKIDGEITDAKAETARLLQLLHLTEEQLAAMT